MISGFRREVYEKCALLGCYAASSGNSLPTFRKKLSAPSSRVKNPRRVKCQVSRVLDSWPLEMETIGCPETSVWNCYYPLHNSQEERSCQINSFYGLFTHYPFHYYSLEWPLIMKFPNQIFLCDFRFPMAVPWLRRFVAGLWPRRSS
jgi:hypothetical protein